MTAQQRRTTAAARLVPGALAEGTAAFPSALPTHGPESELRYENIVYSCEPGYRPLFLDLSCFAVLRCYPVRGSQRRAEGGRVRDLGG
jgi:hypothetical protein